MIQKIGAYSIINNKNLINNRKVKSQTNPIITDNKDYESAKNINKFSYSSITFKANDTSEVLNLKPDAKIFYNRAKDIAIRYNHEEITPYHFILASIEETEESLQRIAKSPNKEVSEPLSILHSLVNTMAKKNVLVDKEEQVYFIEETQYLKEEILSSLEALPKSKNKNVNPKISNDIKSIIEDIKEDCNSYQVLGSAFNALTYNQINYPSDYLAGFKSLSLYKTNDEVNANWLEHYDTKAVEIWNKLALGSNMFILARDEKEKSRITASIANTVGESKHGNFNRDNTYVYSITENADPTALLKEIHTLKTAEPNKKLVFMIDMDGFFLNTTDKEAFKEELFQLPTIGTGNVKLIFLQNKETNYQFMAIPEIKMAYSNTLEYSIPPIHSYEVAGILNKDKELIKDLKKTFQPEAINKTILLADKMEGNYPEKAVDLLKRISEYYGNTVKKITAKDVEEFAYIASELFNKNTDSAVIYDTGKTLASYYGKDTTKKDIENIVKLIKTGRIGTQGMIITSKDDEAGAGKKYTAEVIAGEAKVPFLEINSSDFATNYYDDPMERVSATALMSKLFSNIKHAARQNANKTAILYINNFEDFAFSGAYNPGYKQALSQLQREMEKAIQEDINILVMGGTYQEYANYIPILVKDFSQNIVVDSPAFNKASRKEIIENLIDKKNIPLAYKTKTEKEALINNIVKITEYLSFVNIKDLIQKTNQIMYERNKKKAGLGEFIEAYLQITTGRTSRPEMPISNKELITSHECGHATNLEVMNNLFNSKGQPWFQYRDVNFITLDPRGDFLGAVFEGKSDNIDYPFEAMFSDIVCAYGGYSCEKEFYNMDGSSGISQDLATATKNAKRGVEYFGLGYYTGKVSNAAKILSGEFNEKIYKDIDVILTNAQIVSDLITETYKDFNIWFTQKYSKLIGTDKCMIDGEEFRKQLNTWIASQSSSKKEEFNILEDMILDIIKSTKNGKIYYHAKKIVK